MSLEKQVEYLRKLSQKNIRFDEICDFLTLIVEDNALQIKNPPVISFRNLDSVNGDYGDNEITMDLNEIKTVALGMKSVSQLLKTLGHELRHHWQRTAGIEEYLQSHADEYYQKINEAVKNDTHEGARLNLLANLEDYLVSNSHDLSAFIELPFFKEWIDSLEESGRITFLKEDVEYSCYLQMADEEDARYGGILFVNLMLNEYYNFALSINDQEVIKYVSELREEVIQFCEEYDNKLELYEDFKAFKNIFKDVAWEVLEKLNLLKNGRQKDFKLQAIYSSLLDLYADEYFSRLEAQQAEDLLMAHAENYFSKINENADLTRDLSKVILEKVVSSQISLERKKKFAEYIFYRVVKEVDTHTFTDEDYLLNYYSCNNLISSQLFYGLVEKLADDGRIYEAIDLLEGKHIRNKYLNDTVCEKIIPENLKFRMELLEEKYEQLKNKAISKNQKAHFKEYFEKVMSDIEGYVELLKEGDDYKTFEEVQSEVYQEINFDKKASYSMLKNLGIDFEIEQSDLPSRKSNFKLSQILESNNE